MTEGPHEYDCEYRRPLPGPIQVRIGHTTVRGDVRRFFVQLEYRFDETWHEVVRYDHDPAAPEEMRHDVTKEGLHMDIYREDEKVDIERVSPPLPSDRAFNRAEEHLTEQLERIIKRFEEWHEIRRR